MSNYEYVEDLYIEIYVQLIALVEPADSNPLTSFYFLIMDGKSLTEKQGFFLLKLLKKYRLVISSLGLDSELIDLPVWKNEFRQLDQTKHISISVLDEVLYLTLKHPFAFKEKFEKEVCDSKTSSRSIWNDQEKQRHYPLYDLNLVLVRDFAEKHGFSVSKEFVEAVDYTEQIWEDHKNYEPYCIIDKDQILLKNSLPSSDSFFAEHQNFNINHDLMLAKKMGFRLVESQDRNRYLTKICQTDNNIFYLKELHKFFDLKKEIPGKVCVILGNEIDDVKEFVETAFFYGHNNSAVKICFREPNDNAEGSKFNRWIKENGLGGDLKTAEFLIFKSKLPKWLIAEENDINIILIRSTIPPSSEVSQRWINNHHCVIYSDITTPSVRKEQFSVEL